MDLNPVPGVLARRRDALLERLLEDLEQDERVRAVWLGGSFGRGTADDWSDLDLCCAIRDDDLDDWLGDQQALYRRAGRPLLIGPARPLSAPLVGETRSVMFAGPVPVDWEVQAARTAARHSDTRVMIERMSIPIVTAPIIAPEERRQRIVECLGFFWSMCPIAIKYIGRGSTARAVTQIDLLANTFVELWRLVHDLNRVGAGGANWLHPERDAGLIQRLPRAGAVIDTASARSVLRGLMNEVVRLDEDIARMGVSSPRQAVQEIETMLSALEL